MGISVDQWRSVIGRFSSIGRFSVNCKPLPTQACCERSLQSICLKLCVVLSLLAIGCVELNPGPQSIEMNCRLCSFSTASARCFVNHQKIHNVGRNFQFRCPLCVFKTSKGSNLETHISRVHVSKVEKQSCEPLNPGTSPSAQCTHPGCEVSVSSVKELCKHLCEHIKNGETVDCPFGLCISPQKPEKWVSTFSKAHNFNMHVQHYHKSALLHVSPSAAEPPAQLAEVPMDVSSEASCSHETSVTDDIGLIGREEDETCSIDEVCNFIAKFYLKLEGELFLPASTVQVIADHLSTIVNFCHPIIKRTMINEVMQLGVKKEDAARVAHVSLTDDPLYRVHNKNFGAVCLSSQYLRYKFYKEHYNFEEPVRVNIKGNQGSVQSMAKAKTIHIVPLRSSLTKQLEDPEVQASVDASLNRISSGEMNSAPGENFIYSDFTDGEVFRKHPASKERCLYLNLFWDSFGTTNPLGSAKNIHKTIGVYYVLGNLPPEKRSRVDVLQLSGLFFESHFKSEKLDVCMEPFVEELKNLQENGIQYKGEVLPVYLLFMLGDNLGAHQIGGFVEAFNCEYWCRFCDISKTEFQEKPYIVKSLRTIEEYEACAQKVKTEIGITSWLAVKFTSILNTLKGFHVCLPALPPCIGHDLFEGVVAYDMMLIISRLIKQKWFTRVQLNTAILNFKFAGVDTADKPSTIELGPNKKLKAKLSGSAVKNWNMLRYFSLIIHDYVQDVKDPVWQLYLKLKQICEITCAPQISSEDILKLDALIKDYLSERKRLFTVNLKPKHHFLAHYPTLIRKFGPLIRLFTLRMESHHYILKRCAKACNNFKDITYTMAFKNQLRRAYLSLGSLLSDEFSYTVTRGFVPLWEPEARETITQLELPDSAVCVNTVKINGTEYKRGMWLLIGREESTLIVGEIIGIFCHSSVVFLVKNFNSTVEPDDFGLHEINRTVCRGISHVSSLQKIESYYPLQAYNVSGRLLISLKHSPVPCEVA